MVTTREMSHKLGLEKHSHLKKTSSTAHLSSFSNLKGNCLHSVFMSLLPAGFSNTGMKPQIALARIRDLLGYQATSPDHTDETMLGNMTITRIKCCCKPCTVHLFFNIRTEYMYIL